MVVTEVVRVRDRPCGKESVSSATDLSSNPAFPYAAFPGRVIPVLYKLVPHCYPARRLAI